MGVPTCASRQKFTHCTHAVRIGPGFGGPNPLDRRQCRFIHWVFEVGSQGPERNLRDSEKLLNQIFWLYISIRLCQGALRSSVARARNELKLALTEGGRFGSKTNHIAEMGDAGEPHLFKINVFISQLCISEKIFCDFLATSLNKEREGVKERTIFLEEERERQQVLQGYIAKPFSRQYRSALASNTMMQVVVKVPKSEGVVDPKSGERRRVSLPFEWQQGEEGRSEREFLEMRLEEADGYERAR
ncbi:hypothetical protein TNCV_3800051 [Trichonephila clavipes]|nr:hypothetical protein TNCV_3800051 [Trichonephila clavipes]